MNTAHAEAIRAACIAAARDAYEDAGFAGMCEEGRWERALDAIRALDLEVVIEATRADSTAANDDAE